MEVVKTHRGQRTRPERQKGLACGRGGVRARVVLEVLVGAEGVLDAFVDDMDTDGRTVFHHGRKRNVKAARCSRCSRSRIRHQGRARGV